MTESRTAKAKFSKQTKQGNTAVLTFDVELFFGKECGNINDTIIRPLELIIGTMQEFNVRGVFFIDTLFLRFLEGSDRQSFEQLTKILKNLHSLGHILGLHLHPHWLDAENEDGRISFKTYDRFRLHALTDQEIDSAFCVGCELIKSITGKPPIHFRAGGWSIMPFGRLKQAFLRHGIQVDSSVVPGMASDARPLHYYDYRTVSAREPYTFSEDVLREDAANSVFLELPVTTFRVFNIVLAVNYLLNICLGNRRMSKGSGVQQPVSIQLHSLFKTRTVYLDIERFHPLLFKMLMFFLSGRDFMVFAVHPKNLKNLSYKNLAYVCQRLKVTTKLP